jgi:hypothetical protein
VKTLPPSLQQKTESAEKLVLGLYRIVGGPLILLAMLIMIFLLGGCGNGGGTGDCFRPDEWRDAVVMDEMVHTVVIAEDCGNELEITEAVLMGTGFTADLPEVGDIIDAGDFSIDVEWLDQVDTSGDYSATLKISALGLNDQPPKELSFTVEGDSE